MKLLKDMELQNYSLFLPLTKVLSMDTYNTYLLDVE